MKRKLILSPRSITVVVCLLTTFLQPAAVVFAQNGNPCANHPLGQQICQRALQQQGTDVDRLDLTPEDILQAERIDDLDGNIGAAAGLTRTVSNVSLSDVTQDNPFLGILLGVLTGYLQGSAGNIGSMFQNLNSTGVQSYLTNNSQNYYPDQSCYYDYRHCIATFLAPAAYNQSIPGMGNFGNMGNIGNIGGSMFGGYNVGSGNTGGGIPGLIGGGNGNGIFGIFGSNNNQNGSWLGTILTTVGTLTGNTSLIMAGQVLNTLNAMNQQNQMMPTQGGVPQDQQNPWTAVGNNPLGTNSNPLGTNIGNADYSQYLGGDGSMPVSTSGSVSKDDLFAYMNNQVKNSDLNGYVPADGAKYGIDGSSESWARYFTELAGKESSYNTGTVGDVGQFGSGSRGLFQLSTADATNYGLQSTGFSHDQLSNPYTNANAAISITSSLVKQDGVIAGTSASGNALGASRYWGPLQRGWTPVGG